MDKNSYSDLWSFIADYLPDYYSREDVLRSDILFRYVNHETVDDNDVEWIKDEFGNDMDAIKQESALLEKRLVSEALDHFYKQL